MCWNADPNRRLIGEHNRAICAEMLRWVFNHLRDAGSFVICVEVGASCVEFPGCSRPRTAQLLRLPVDDGTIVLVELAQAGADGARLWYTLVPMLDGQVQCELCQFLFALAELGKVGVSCLSQCI